MTKNDIRCILCAVQYSQQIVNEKKITQCPNCGVKATPLKTELDIWLKINWDELRIMAIYAQRWGATFDINNAGNREAINILTKIVNGLYKYKPFAGGTLNPEIKTPHIAEDIEARKIRGVISPYYKKGKID